MDFFEHQQESRQRSRLLVLLFLLGVAGVVGAVTAFIRFAFWVYFQMEPETSRFVVSDVQVALGVAGLITLASLFKLWQLRRDGISLAYGMGASRVLPDTRDEGERKLQNVVEEMAIASGLPVPGIFILPDEAGINALAMGHQPADAAVVVTQGAVRQMNRDELQGVVAHEFAHILNGDMRVNLRLIGWVYGLLAVAMVGESLLRGVSRGSSRRSSKGGSGALAALILGLGLYIIGWIGVFFGRLIKAAVSRQREFLADACAVQFTRNPSGLAGALRRAGGAPSRTWIERRRAEEMSHLLFASGRKLSGWMSTHPPLAERIARLEGRPSLEWEVTAGASLPSSPLPQEGMGLVGEAASGHAPEPGSYSASQLLGSVGSITATGVAEAAAMRERLPLEVLQASRTPQRAGVLLWALLLSESESEDFTSLGEVPGDERLSGMCREALELLPAVRRLRSADRLPLLDLTLPSLRLLLSAPERVRFLEHSRRLIERDGRKSLGEFVLYAILERRLVPRISQGEQSGPFTLSSYAAEVCVLLSAVARAGAGGPEVMRRAFQRGRDALGVSGGWLQSPSLEAALATLPPALAVLAGAPADIRRQVLQAVSQVVEADGQLAEEEALLLRGVAEALDCPMPLLEIPRRTGSAAAARGGLLVQDVV